MLAKMHKMVLSNIKRDLTLLDRVYFCRTKNFIVCHSLRDAFFKEEKSKPNILVLYMKFVRLSFSLRVNFLYPAQSPGQASPRALWILSSLKEN
jgi:hypothetical protein